MYSVRDLQFDQILEKILQFQEHFSSLINSIYVGGLGDVDVGFELESVGLIQELQGNGIVWRLAFIVSYKYLEYFNDYIAVEKNGLLLAKTG